MSGHMESGRLRLLLTSVGIWRAVFWPTSDVDDEWELGEHMVCGQKRYGLGVAYYREIIRFLLLANAYTACWIQQKQSDQGIMG